MRRFSAWIVLLPLLGAAPAARAEWRQVLAPGVDTAATLRQARAALAATRPRDPRRPERLARLGLVAFELNRTTEAMVNLREAADGAGRGSFTRAFRAQIETELGALDVITSRFADANGIPVTLAGRRNSSAGWAAEARRRFASADASAGAKAGPADPRRFVSRMYRTLLNGVTAAPSDTADALAVLAAEARRVLGEGHPVTIQVGGARAAALLADDEAAQARPLAEAMLAVARRRFGERHPLTADAHDLIATVLAQLHEADDGAEHMRASLAFRATVDDDADLSLLWQALGGYEVENKVGDPAASFTRAVEYEIAASGARSSQVSALLSLAGLSLRDEFRLNDPRAETALGQAERFLRRAVAIAGQDPAQDDELAADRTMLAVVLRRLAATPGHAQMAERLRDEAAELERPVEPKAPPPPPPDVRAQAIDLAGHGKADEAVALLTRQIAAWRVQKPLPAREIARAALTLAEVEAGRGQFAAAQDAAKQGEAVLATTSAPDPASLAGLLFLHAGLMDGDGAQPGSRDRILARAVAAVRASAGSEPPYRFHDDEIARAVRAFAYRPRQTGTAVAADLVSVLAEASRKGEYLTAGRLYRQAQPDDPEARADFTQAVADLVKCPDAAALEQAVGRTVPDFWYASVLGDAARSLDARGRPEMADALLAAAAARARGEGRAGTGRGLVVEAVAISRAVARGSTGPFSRSGIVSDLAEILALRGEAGAALAFADAQGDPSAVQNAALKGGDALLRLGRREELVALAGAAPRAAQPMLRAVLDRPAPMSSLVAETGGDPGRVIALAGARRGGDLAAGDLVDAAEEMTRHGDAQAAQTVLARAVDLARAQDDTGGRVLVMTNAASALMAAGDPAGARAAAMAALDARVLEGPNGCGGDGDACRRRVALDRIAAVLLQIGGEEAARPALDAIGEPRGRLGIIADYARDLGRSGREPDALALAARLLRQAAVMTNDSERGDIVGRVGVAQAAAGLLDAGLLTVREGAGEVLLAYRLDQVRQEAVGRSVRLGELDRARDVAKGMEDRETRAKALAGVAEAMAKAGRRAEADRLFAAAVAVAESYMLEGLLGEAGLVFDEIAGALADAQDLGALDIARLGPSALGHVNSAAQRLLRADTPPADVAAALTRIVAGIGLPGSPAARAQDLARLAKLQAVLGLARESEASAAAATAALSDANRIIAEIPARLAALVENVRNAPVTEPWEPWDVFNFIPLDVPRTLQLSLEQAASTMAESAVEHGRTDVAGKAQLLREFLARKQGTPVPAAEALRARLALVVPATPPSDIMLSGRADGLHLTVLPHLDDPGAAPLVLQAVRESTRLEDAAARARAARIGPYGRGRLPPVDGTREPDAFEAQAGRRYLYALHLDRLGHALAAAPGDAALQEEAFRVTVRALEGELSFAVAQALARQHRPGDDAPGTTELRRRVGVLEQQERSIDAGLWDARLGGRVPDPLRFEQATKVRDELRSARRDLRRQFTTSLALFDDEPPTLAEVSACLGEDEAVLAYVIGNRGPSLGMIPATYVPTYVPYEAVIVRRSGLTIVPLPDALGFEQEVAALRAALVPPPAPANVLSIQSMGTYVDPMAGFPFDAAHRLFKRILGPAMPALAGVRHLMVVPDGALAGLPFAVLLPTPQQPAPTTPDWLILHMTLSMLPSLPSLPALAARQAMPLPPLPFIGFGNPLFRGTADQPPSTTADPLASVLDLPAVPATAEELSEIARSLGADPAVDVHLGGNATKAAVRQAPLSQAQVVAFATHGLLRREIKNLYEPALALMPGPEPLDDGLLTASEIASFRLSADWVLLIACNTARPDDAAVGTQLSSLARAFLYAGARSLLVSQWAVAVDATKMLVTNTIASTARSPNMSKAEALAETMRSMALGKHGSLYQHPYFWSAFIMVGADVE